MTLIIQNVKEEYLPAFKGLAEGTNATLRAESSDEVDECPICKEYGYNPSDRLKKAVEEVSEMEKNPNDYPSYSNAKEMIEACLND